MINYLDDALAAIIIVGCILLLALHIDGDIKAILGVAAGYVFGKRVVPAAKKK